MADCIFGLVGKDFVLLACDRSVSRSVLKIQDCDEKITSITNNQLLATCGEVSERKGFSNLIKVNRDYYYFRYNNSLNTSELANFTRNLLSESLRQDAIPVNCLIAGFDNNEPSLYWLDYLGTLQKVTRGAQGYCGYFLGGLLDNYYKTVKFNL